MLFLQKRDKGCEIYSTNKCRQKDPDCENGKTTELEKSRPTSR